MAREDALYVRNARPNMIVFSFNGVRYALQHRGNRQDSAALPPEAASDATISRWLKNGQLEKISKEAFMRLGARSVDVLPNRFLAQKVRTPRGGAVPMEPAEADTTRSLTQVSDAGVQKSVREQTRLEWAGELMSTEEELEELQVEQQERNYPSRHRDEDTRSAGY